MTQKAALLLFCLFASVALCAQSMSVDFKSDITEGCSPIVVKFQSIVSGDAKILKWDFGNGATSSLQEPSTTYFDPGTYTVSLTVFNEDETDSSKVVKTAYITVYEEPQANFISNKQTGCSPHTIQFSDASIAPPGTNIVSWKWMVQITPVIFCSQK